LLFKAFYSDKATVFGYVKMEMRLAGMPEAIGMMEMLSFGRDAPVDDEGALSRWAGAALNAVEEGPEKPVF